MEGYIKVMSRVDDVINVAGHRLSTSALEEPILHHPAVTECAVIPIPDQIKGFTPLGVIVLKSGRDIFQGLSVIALPQSVSIKNGFP